jgi:RNA-directed DNA polymerase
VNWVLDADILGFFDHLSHEWAIKFIEHRVADRRILRLIQKWLKAGVWRITAKKRMVAKLKAIKVELQRRMHDRMADVGAWLRRVVLGYYQYHAVPGNTTQLRIFKLRVCRRWHSVLVRRSQRAQMRWERLTQVLNRWIPPPRVLHPYPDARFYATHPS